MIPITRFADDLFGKEQWYVLRSKPGDERRAKMNLSHQGIESFLRLFES